MRPQKLTFMKQYQYIRSSTPNQNNTYQKNSNYEMFIDVCSGTIPFRDRESGGKLLDIIKEHDVISVTSLERLGRNSLDCLETLSFLKKKKVKVELQNLGISSILESGLPNPAFEIVCSVLSVISEQFIENLRHTQLKGIAIAKAKGNVYLGRKKGSVISRDIFLERNKKAIQIIKKHPTLSLRDLAKLTNISHVKVKKIKEML